MNEAYIVEAVRTPIGKKKGGLADWHPADLGAQVLNALMQRAGVDPALIDDVVFGCVDTIGPLAGDIARTCWLAAGLPEHVPGTTVDRQCGSSQQAVHFAAQGVMSGTQDLVVAGGVQVMNQIPIGAAMLAGRQYGHPDPFLGSVGWRARYGETPLSQFRSAEMIAAHWKLSRRDMEEFALEREKMATLPTIEPEGLITAAVASQIADASAALLIASGEAVKRYGLKARARIHHLSVRAADPVWMLTAPITATRHALAKAGMTLADIDLVEINEAFAAVVLAWAKELDADMDRVNVNGGAIALGHPLGATGARLMTSMLYELERRGGRFGLQTMCEGGGQANVTIIERLD
ncbi:MAG: beta-ketoacyl synthase N-terminal-like domain-containing protein [Proteobacteria bacterium]|nr:beta-ketoacyl synthase N-terminal-like domain-containing protein [Pseudomonadota bacterium]